MIYSVRYVPSFFINLLEIENYYRANESDSRADKVLLSITKELERIIKKPFEFPVYEKSTNICIRRAVVHSTFIILFEIIENQILVLDIYHGKQDI